MSNFFGFDTADSFFDKRRHINLVYYSMMYLRFLSNNSYELNKIKQTLSANNSALTRANLMRRDILSDYEVSFLDYLQRRYDLPENDYITI